MVQEREHACGMQPEDDGCADHQLFLLLLFGETLLSFGFLVFSKPLARSLMMPCQVPWPNRRSTSGNLVCVRPQLGVDCFGPLTRR